MASGSVDAVVTDPPYGLRFMGKRWDYDVPSVEVWAECLRVLKPGGHLLAFAGTRTQHRMACRIEDAGFEIRDMIAWVYGSGFPKSLDVSKAIDKAAGAEREVIVPNPNSRPNMVRVGASVLAPRVDAPLTAPATVAACRRQGWGTALKPALEPITMARKPLSGTVAANVLEHGTGAINVDGCRVAFAGEDDEQKATAPGRWPANLIHDGGEGVLSLFPDTGKSAGGRTIKRSGGGNVGSGKKSEKSWTNADPGYGDTGSAARFFYCAKASKRERGDSKHPTVKPVALMRYLVRLATPPGGLVLDPFMGTGTTGVASLAEGFRFVGFEREAEYFETAKRRMEEP
jgi:site-specific DNA-methyltransferase (adenine-specific)